MAYYKELVQDKKIHMTWRMKDWKFKEGSADLTSLDAADAANAFSDVIIDFSEADHDDEMCLIKLTQTNIPEYDRYDKFVHLENLE